MALKMNGEAPFPQAGEGCFLCFPAGAIAKLEEIYGLGEYFGKIEAGLNDASGKVMIDCLTVGLFVRDAAGKRVKAPFDENELVFPVSDSAGPILDALSLSTSGKTYGELIEAAIKRQAEMEAALNAQDSDEVADEGKADPFEVLGE